MIIFTKDLRETVLTLTEKPPHESIIRHVSSSDLPIRVIEENISRKNVGMVHININEPTMGYATLDTQRVCLLISNAFNIPYNQVYNIKKT